jgi:hypothetical protein
MNPETAHSGARLWLPSFHHQDRDDLDLATVTTRRDAFLAAALRAIG